MDKFKVKLTRTTELVLNEETYHEVQLFIDTELPITEDDVRDWLMDDEGASIEMMEEEGTNTTFDWEVTK